jgi:hypothetical protein
VWGTANHAAEVRQVRSQDYISFSNLLVVSRHKEGVMRRLPRCFAAAVAVSAIASSSLAGGSGSYKVSATLSHAGKPFAAPSAVVLTGQPASIEVAGRDGYKITLTVTDVAVDKIQVVAQVNSAHGSMHPTVVVHPNQPATVSVGDLELELSVRSQWRLTTHSSGRSSATRLRAAKFRR